LSRPKSLEEIYPDAEGSIYYHPIDNPYGVPPPGCFPMFKPGYILKAQRHLLPFNHPLHPNYTLSSPSPSSAIPHPTGPFPLAMSNAHRSMDHMEVDQEGDMGEGDDDDDEDLDALEELEGIPPPPTDDNASDSDGDIPPPPPPTTEDDVPGVFYDDNDMDADDDADDDDPSAYFEVEETREKEMLPPAPKRGPMSRPHHHHHYHHPSGSHGHPPLPPPYGMPPPPMLFPSFFPPPPGMLMPQNPSAVLFPPPPGPFRTPENLHSQDRDQNQDSRRQPKRNGPPNPKDKKNDSKGGIPDPLDMGPLKKEGRGANNATPSSTTTSSSSSSTGTGSSTSSSTQPKTNNSDTFAGLSPMLVPSSVRIKRKVPTEVRPVAPRVAVQSQTQPQDASSHSSAAPSNPSNLGFDQFMSDMKQMGAIQ
jgi:hypothetical protein